MFISWLTDLMARFILALPQTWRNVCISTKLTRLMGLARSMAPSFWSGTRPIQQHSKLSQPKKNTRNGDDSGKKTWLRNSIRNGVILPIVLIKQTGFRINFFALTRKENFAE